MRNFVNAALLGVAMAAVDYTDMGANWADDKCVNGKEQSPIDLTGQTMNDELALMWMDYKNYEAADGLLVKDLGKTL